jgi:hypothetical protein
MGRERVWSAVAGHAPAGPGVAAGTSGCGLRVQRTGLCLASAWPRCKGSRLSGGTPCLVISIARRFPATGLPLGNLVQKGNLGLLQALVGT